MTILIVWSGEDIREVFGPFESDQHALEWAEEMFPRRHCTTEEMRRP